MQKKKGFNYWYDDQARLIAVQSSPFVSRETIRYESDSQLVVATVDQNRVQRVFTYTGDQSWDVEVKRKTYRGLKTEQQLRFWFKSLNGGHSWLTHREFRQQGVTTKTELTRSGLPLRIEREGYVTHFRYAPDSERFIEKITPSTTINISYDAIHHHISRVDKHWNDGASTWSAFAYNAQGHLSHAENHLGKRVDLLYGKEGSADQGRIIQMIEKERVMRFRYNQLGKPSHIQMKDVGGIDVEYDDAGEITSVKSDGDNDSRIALKVTQMFQSLLGLVKPAGVDFNF
ncbi:MAG: hypothetical protein Q9M28_04125 [Mariprofundaceae bacterium]|nr:hypothetical protein [Mariprofundaceae bacterium]